MLERLTIRDLAIFEMVSLELGAGFTVLTGETGAGKSILIDALGLVLGARAEASVVRGSAERAEVVAEFSLRADSSARAWLAAQALLDEAEPGRCTVRRLLQREGRTRAFINDRPAGAAALREFGEHLIEIFGQGESQTLLRPEVQRRLVDDYGEHGEALSLTAQAAGEVAQIRGQLAALQASGGPDPARMEWLRFAIAELSALSVSEGEWQQLEDEHRQLVHGERILQEGSAVRESLYGGESSTYDQLSALSARLEQLARLHDGFRPPQELIDTAQAQLRDAADELQSLVDRVDLDPARLAEAEQRIGAIHEMARKHRVAPADLHALQEQLGAELSAMGRGEERQAELRRDEAAALARYRNAATRLTGARKQAAEGFATAVQTRVRQLGLPNALLSIAVEPTGRADPSVHGEDSVRIDFSANPGEAPQALARIASGGELSRISLAIQVVARQKAAAGTLIFDEVDAGIGGGIAEIVGAELAQLGQDRQVLCVTHLAQVAAQGDAHLQVRKEVIQQQTFAQVAELDQAGRVAELSRMAGGREITDATQAHARELLQRAKRKPQP
jgi:DNA repair protein RecN (Recombination protein N)